jgi:RNA polymerase sigma factor (sigma-70 family)
VFSRRIEGYGIVRSESERPPAATSPTNGVRMDDALLVSRAIGGDLDSFGQLYDRYFHRVYDFCWRILRDDDEAADATQDAFMKTMQALPSLGKAASFKSWLFTIAHNVAVTRAERAGRTTPLPAATAEEGFGAFEAPDPSRIDNPELAAIDQEQSDLVWEAVSALNPRDYALLDLHVRQGLESAEIAGVMGVSKGNAYTMVSRMKQAAGDVITSYIVARRGNRDCEGLQAVLAPFSLPPYTDAARRAVDAHIKECDVCQGSRRALAAPLEIFGAFAMVPAPFALKGDVWRNLVDGWQAGPLAGAAVAPATAAPEAPPGFGSALGIGGGGGGGGGVLAAGAGGGESPKRTVLLFIGGVIGLLAIAFGGAALMAVAFGGDDDGGRGGGADATTTRPARTAQPRTPGIVIDTATPDLTPSATPTPEDTPTPEPPTPIPPPPTSTPPPVPTATIDNSTATLTPRPTRTLVATPTVPPSPNNTPTPPPTVP